MVFCVFVRLCRCLKVCHMVVPRPARHVGEWNATVAVCVDCGATVATSDTTRLSCTSLDLSSNHHASDGMISIL
jgi:hypothetical protein